jgi:hypothetical protein
MQLAGIHFTFERAKGIDKQYQLCDEFRATLFAWVIENEYIGGAICGANTMSERNVRLRDEHWRLGGSG